VGPGRAKGGSRGGSESRHGCLERGAGGSLPSLERLTFSAETDTSDATLITLTTSRTVACPTPQSTAPGLGVVAPWAYRGQQVKGDTMARKSLRSQLYRAARDLGNVEAAGKGPAAYGRRVVRRKVYRQTNGALGKLLRGILKG